MEHGKDNRPDMQDAEERQIDMVLSLASEPPVPADAMTRLMARIAAEPQDARVISFTPRPRGRGTFFRYAAALPLAASLALGVYLGAQGTLDFMLPSAITGGVAWNDEGTIDDLGGVGDADAYAQDSTT